MLVLLLMMMLLVLLVLTSCYYTSAWLHLYVIATISWLTMVTMTL